MKTTRVTDLRTGIVRDAAPTRDWKQCARAMRAADINGRKRERQIAKASRMLWAYVRMKAR